MPMVVRRTQSVRIDEGMYKAIVASIQQKTGKQNSVFYIWTFMVKNATFKGKKLPENTKVTGITSERFSKTSKMYEWGDACGIDVSGDELDLEECINCAVRIKIEDKDDSEILQFPLFQSQR